MNGGKAGFDGVGRLHLGKWNRHLSTFDKGKSTYQERERALHQNRGIGTWDSTYITVDAIEVSHHDAVVRFREMNTLGAENSDEVRVVKVFKFFPFFYLSPAILL